jgi:FkbM family methyltransferase
MKWPGFLTNLFSNKKAEINQALSAVKAIDFYKQFVKEGDLCFDVGANVGNRIDAFLALNVKVIAVEPQPDCVAALHDKFGEEITVVPVGLGAAPGTATMHIANETTISTFSKEFIQSTSKTRFKRNKWEQTMEVPIRTMDSLVEEFGRPVFCKIDVEGFELEVLKGLTKPVPYLSFEYCVPEMNARLYDCINYLHSLEPNTRFNYSIGETMELAMETWVDHAAFMEIAKSKAFVDTLFGDVYVKMVDG